MIFKARSSQVYRLMTKPQKKDNILSKTTIAYLQEWFLEKKYGFKKEIESKYFTKGNECESLSINLASIYFNDVFQKNDEFFENDFITGTPDVIKDNIVYDVKTSWNITTFPFFEDEAPPEYMWQGQSYLWLTGLECFKLCYCLINTPDHLIQDEIRKYCWKNNIMDCPDELEQEIRNQHVYDNIPIEQRIKVIEIFRDNDKIKQIEEQVIKCREYLQQSEIKL